MKLLLHTCCAPCLIHPAEELKKDGFEVSAFFYNPNIHPLEEYNRRKQAIADLNSAEVVKIIYPKYDPAEFLDALKGQRESPQRCFLCWSLRMKKTAQHAKHNGFFAFSTTLLVSPYQDQEMLKNIGSQVSSEEGIFFHYQDFRPGFRKAHEQARAKGLYCQRYCGCEYSERERCKKSQKR